MNIKNLLFPRFVFGGLFCMFITASGCSSAGWVPQWSGSGFIKKEFLDYKKVAVLPFKGDPKGEASDTFARSFHERFRHIALFDRKQLVEIFQEQELYSDRLNQATERKIGEDFGVQALITGDVYYPSILRWLLQVQIIDIETGEVLGRSLVEINYMGAEGVKEACEIAVQNLTLR